MQSFTTIVAASALLAGVSASPLAIRSTCGAAPSASGSQAPLSQLTGITTAEACQAKCEAVPSCLSFLFGMVNNVDECMLYPVAASAIPSQSSSNLVAYDVACSAVPNVVPTTANPQGLATTGNAVSNNTPAQNHKRDTCGGAPTGPTGSTAPAPISTPSNIATIADCMARCVADPSCKSFEFGTLINGGADVCRLFAVAAASVPAPTSGQSFIVYDVGCSI